jgi:hypothetical protein
MPKIMATYNRNEMLPERKEALNQWARYIETVTKNSNIVAFKKCSI